MINAIIQNKHGETLLWEFPGDIFTLQSDLHAIEIDRWPSKIKLTDEEDDPIRVKLYADNDFGNHLLRLFADDDTLEDVHTVVGAVTNAPDEVKEALEEYVLYDQLESKEDLYDTIRELKEANAPIVTTFYCPLSAQLHDEEYGEVNDISSNHIKAFAYEIEEAVRREQSPDFEMADYITDHPTADAKLLMATWSVDMIDGTLYGRIDCCSAEPFTEEEIEALKDGICGQNSDGFGEGFEQRPIRTDEGDLYVSFWHSGDDYFIHTQEEMDEYINQNHSMKMGGM